MLYAKEVGYTIYLTLYIELCQNIVRNTIGDILKSVHAAIFHTMKLSSSSRLTTVLDELSL